MTTYAPGKIEMLRFVSERWQRLTGRGVTEDFTAPLEERMESKRREALQAEYDALRAASESAHDSVLETLTASKRAELERTDESRAYSDHARWIGRG